MFTDLPNADVCFRSLTKTGPVGCSTSSHEGEAGILRHISSPEELSSILSSSIPYDFMAVIEGPIYHTSLWKKLIEAHPTHFKGGLLIHTPGAERPENGQSDSLISPYGEMDLHASTPYAWNPRGSGAIRELQPVPLATVSGAEAEDLRARAIWNEERITNSTHPGQKARIRAYMYAGNELENGYGPDPAPENPTSIDCLAQRTCAPVGGYSAWASFGNATATASDSDGDEADKPIVLAAAALDTAALFRRRATGAESTLSHVSVFLGAAESLSRVHNITQLPRNILFMGFDAEKWGRIGSRRFVEDIAKPFTCPEDQVRGGGSTTYCLSPFRGSTVFTGLSLDRIAAVIELNQVALDTTLFAHVEKGDAAAAELVTLAKAVADDVPGVSPFGPYSPTDRAVIKDADPDTPGLPPSSAQSFVLSESGTSIPALVLTDHAGEYKNKFHDSIFDDIAYTGRDRGYNQLCSHATLYARLLYAAATEMKPNNDGTLTPEQIQVLEPIRADCDLVADLQYCLAANPGCARLKPFISSSYTPEMYLLAPPYYYSSVYYPSTAGYVGGLPRLVRSWLGSAVRNATARDRGLSDEDADKVGRWAQFHDALDPALEFSLDKNRFVVKEPEKAKGMIWTESNWDSNIGVTLFREEDPKVVEGAWIAGIAVLLACFLGTFLLTRWCSRVFKHI